MIKELIHTPEGVRDIYGTEYKQKEWLLSKLKGTIALHGYEGIETPDFEYFDVFSREIGTTPSKDLYKFFDREGDTLALRPDFTPGVARCVAKYFDKEQAPVKLTYAGSAFVNSSSLQGKLKESTHVGVELMNDASVMADAEVINLAVEALKSTGLTEFVISVGHVQYFKGLCAAAGMKDEDIHTLREYISEKNLVPATSLLDELNCDAATKDLLISSGEVRGIDGVRELIGKVNVTSAKEALQRLMDLYEILKIYGNERFVSFDLSLLSKYNYYTGVIFKAYTYGAGDAILKGGRYDNLVSFFGTPKPATGFVILADDLLMALRRSKVHLPSGEEVTILTYTENDYSDKIKEANRLRAENKAVSLVPSK